jgi:hypothetical protein
MPLREWKDCVGGWFKSRGASKQRKSTTSIRLSKLPTRQVQTQSLLKTSPTLMALLRPPSLKVWKTRPQYRIFQLTRRIRQQRWSTNHLSFVSYLTHSHSLNLAIGSNMCADIRNTTKAPILMPQNRLLRPFRRTMIVFISRPWGNSCSV